MISEDMSSEALIVLVTQLAQIQKDFRIAHLKVGQVEMVCQPETQYNIGLQDLVGNEKSRDNIPDTEFDNYEDPTMRILKEGP